jgi:hypothetical protein
MITTSYINGRLVVKDDKSPKIINKTDNKKQNLRSEKTSSYMKKIGKSIAKKK